MKRTLPENDLSPTGETSLIEKMTVAAKILWFFESFDDGSSPSKCISASTRAGSIVKE